MFFTCYQNALYTLGDLDIIIFIRVLIFKMKNQMLGK